MAALGDPAHAAEEWERLRPDFHFEELEPGSFDLLPLIYRNLVAAGADDPLMRRLKGIYRKSWVTNTLLLRRSRETYAALTGAGIPTLIVGGPVLAARFYPEFGLRPSSYVDVLIDAPSVEEAEDALGGAGWLQRDSALDRRTDRRLYVDRDESFCLLRTSLAIDFTLPQGRRAAHAPLWEYAETFEIDGAEILVPTRSDWFLAVCVTHARRESPPGTQWIADAKMMLSGDIDWARVVELCRTRGQIPRMKAVLEYLARVPGPQPPPELEHELTDLPVSLRERVVYLCTTRSIRGVGALPWLLAEHLAGTKDASLAGTAASFPAHLRERWGLSRSRQVPGAVVRRAMRVLGRRGRGMLRT